jgi:hypothetical protein
MRAFTVFTKKDFEIHAKRNVFQDCKLCKVLYIHYLNGRHIDWIVSVCMAVKM